MNNKKAKIPVLKVILVLLITSIIFISMMLFFFNSKSVYIDKQKINSQIVIKKILDSNCFSDKYASIEESKFTENNLNNCFKNFNEEVFFSLNIKNLKSKTLVKNTFYYNTDKTGFATKATNCNGFSTKSNLFCKSLIYPITYIYNNGKFSTKLLKIDIILT